MYKDQTKTIYSKIWVQGFPLRMAFFIWRAWKFKVLVNDRIRRWRYEGPLRYWCCEAPHQDTIPHVFLKAFIANRIWSYFTSCAGINMHNLSLREIKMSW